MEILPWSSYSMTKEPQLIRGVSKAVLEALASELCIPEQGWHRTSTGRFGCGVVVTPLLNHLESHHPRVVQDNSIEVWRITSSSYHGPVLGTLRSFRGRPSVIPSASGEMVQPAGWMEL